MTAPLLDLSLHGLSFGAAPVLGPLRLTAAPGEAVALMGPSGIGKSTLLRLAAGLPVAARAEGLQVRRPARIGMAFQEPTLLPWRSAAENIRIACGVDPGPALAEVGLEGKGALHPMRLSLGQRRRLALARALAAAPDLLLLDEPFASLDERTAAEMIALTARLITARPGMATVLVTHAPAEAAALATRALLLGGAPARLMAEAQVRRGDAARLRADLGLGAAAEAGEA